jgi:hypothetical protein
VGLRIWRRQALNNQAQELATRTGLAGRPGKWICTFLAVARQPRLIGAGLDEVAAAIVRQPRLVTDRFAKLAARWRRC